MPVEKRMFGYFHKNAEDKKVQTWNKHGEIFRVKN